VLPDVAHVVDDGFDVVGDALDLIGL
jgi:hypothetical protein